MTNSPRHLKIHSPSQQTQKRVKTHIIGFCYRCVNIHYTPETYMDDGVRRWQYTDCQIDTGGFVPPIPVDVPEEEILAIKENREPDPAKIPQPTVNEIIQMCVEDLAFLLEIDEEKHRAALDDIAARFYSLVKSSNTSGSEE